MEYCINLGARVNRITGGRMLRNSIRSKSSFHRVLTAFRPRLNAERCVCQPMLYVVCCRNTREKSSQKPEKVITSTFTVTVFKPKHVSNLSCSSSHYRMRLLVLLSFCHCIHIYIISISYTNLYQSRSLSLICRSTQNLVTILIT